MICYGCGKERLHGEFGTIFVGLEEGSPGGWVEMGGETFNGFIYHKLDVVEEFICNTCLRLNKSRTIIYLSFYSLVLILALVSAYKLYSKCVTPDNDIFKMFIGLVSWLLVFYIAAFIDLTLSVIKKSPNINSALASAYRIKNRKSVARLKALRAEIISITPSHAKFPALYDSLPLKPPRHKKSIELVYWTPKDFASAEPPSPKWNRKEISNRKFNSAASIGKKLLTKTPDLSKLRTCWPT